VSERDDFGLADCPQERCLGRGQSRAGWLYILTPEPPLSGTFIELLLDVPAGEVRATAIVQRSRPKEGMGVKFVAMGQEDRARFVRWQENLSPWGKRDRENRLPDY